MPEVRPFHRADRDQLTIWSMPMSPPPPPSSPVSLSPANTVLSALERQPDEFITDPRVSERGTLVAEQRKYVVAAAHLLRQRRRRGRRGLPERG